MDALYYNIGEARGRKDGALGRGMDPNLMALDPQERQGYIDGYNSTFYLNEDA